MSQIPPRLQDRCASGRLDECQERGAQWDRRSRLVGSSADAPPGQLQSSRVAIRLSGRVVSEPTEASAPQSGCSSVKSKNQKGTGLVVDTFELGQVHPTAIVSTSASLGARVTVGAFSVIHPGVELGDGSIVGSHCSLGEPTGEFYSGQAPGTEAPCSIGAGAVVRSHSVIYQAVKIGAELRTGHRVTIREGSILGDDVQIGTMSDLQGDLRVGNHVRLHSSVHIGQMSVIDDFVWLFPFVVLTNDPHPPSSTCMQGVTIHRYAVVATKSILMPGVEVGEHALIGAMSLVTRDVEPGSVVVGQPAKLVGPVQDVRCRHGALDAVYPWPRQFRRGYPDGAFDDFDSTPWPLGD